jgi:hypothetical protein
MLAATAPTSLRRGSICSFTEWEHPTRPTSRKGDFGKFGLAGLDEGGFPGGFPDLPKMVPVLASHPLWRKTSTGAQEPDPKKTAWIPAVFTTNCAPP